MTKLRQIYKCEICGNVGEVLSTGAGELVCCGQPMVLQQAKTQDEGMEKHVPVVEKTPTGLKIKVGEIPHPMEENHYIEWVELITNGKSYRQRLEPGQDPEVGFNLQPESYIVREWCNIHGLWETKA